MVDCLNHGLNGLRRFHGLHDVFDGRDSEKISIALIIHSLDLLPMRVCGADRRMAAGFGNPEGAVLGLGSGWKPDVTRGWGIVVVCGSEVSVGKERAREPRPYESQRSFG